MGKNKTYLIVSIVCLILLFWMPGCKKKERASETPSVEPVAESGELHVVYATPQGQTTEQHESEALVVIFDRPLFPLEALDEQMSPEILRIEPDVPGSFRWLNPKTLSFTPKERFPFASEIRATLESGIKTFEGYVLKEDYTWSFSTVRPLLRQHFPRNKQQWLRLDTQVLLIFNQPVLTEENKKNIKVIGLGQDEREVSLEFQVKNPSAKQLEEEGIQAEPEEVLVLQPEQLLIPESSYFIEIGQGLLGKEGPLGMENGRILEFSTFNEFRFEYFEPQRGYDIYQPLKFQFSNPVNYKDFIQKVRFEPEVSIPEYYQEWDQANSTLWLSLAFQPETQYKLWIDAGLEDEFGNKLEKEINLAFETQPYPRSVSMDVGHGLLESYGNLKYPVYAVNADEVFIHGGRVSKDDVIPILETEKVFWTSEKFTRPGLYQVEKFMKLNPARNSREVFPIEVKEFLAAEHGLVFFQLDTLSEDKWERYPKAFLQVTELGISAKFSRENNIIWVTELQTGQSVAEAEVEIRDDANRIRWRGKTDADGKAETPGWEALKIQSQDEWSKPRQWVFVTREADTAFLTSEWGTGVYPYRFDIEYDWNPQPPRFQGYVFTERGIYRAGEAVNIKGMLREREKGDWIIPQIKEVSCEIFDPFQKSVFKEQLKIDEFGSFDFVFETAPKASLGEYQMQTSIPSPSGEKEPFYVYSSFRVEAFRPAEFEVHLRTASESFTFSDTYRGELRGAYLFGGAMSGQNASWYLRLNPTFYSPPGYRGYTFGDLVSRWDTYSQDESRLLASGESALDSEGTLTVTAKLEAEEERDSVLATLEATVTGPSRRSVTNRIQTVVHRGDFYIGLRPSTTFLTKGEEIRVALIAARPDGELYPNRRIRLSLIQREWHSVRKSEFGGRYTWVSEIKDTEIDALTVSSSTEPEFHSFVPDKSGFYILKAEGKDRKGNPIVTTTYFYVTGTDYVPWERLDEDAVELVSDSTDYNPGDTARILVKSPYESAKALITVEREFILDSRVVELQGSSDHVEIPILSEHIPNVYVSVLLVQGRVSPKEPDPDEDIGKPSFKIGYVKLAVDPSEKRLDVDIQTDSEDYRPGDEVKLTLQAKDIDGTGSRACISVAVVDVGVLNLIGYRTPDPFSLFYSHKLLSVQTAEARQHVIGQRVFGDKGEGGGAGEERMAAFAAALNEVELRGDFKFTAYWNPSLQTDDSGEATVTFKLPDNLTTFRVMAVAQTKESQFGRGEKTFKVSKRLLLQPSLPRFARTGDSFQGGVVVFNYSSDKGDVILDCQAEGITLLDTREQQFNLDAGAGKEALFSFQVENPGLAKIAFRARMGDDEDGLEIFLPLQIPRPKETVALSNTTKESVVEQIKIPEDAYPFESLIQFQASSSALSGLKGSVDYLTEYPYLCLEQRLSRILPFIFAEKLILDFGLSSKDRKEIREYVQSNIIELYAYQKPNGGFGFWPDAPQESPFNSCYTAFALAKAAQAGYAIDTQRRDQLIDYMKNLANENLNRLDFPYSEKSWKTVKAFALYSLALLDSSIPSAADRLFTERSQLSLLGEAFLLKALYRGQGSLSTKNTLLQDLMNKIKVSPTDAHFEDDEGRDGSWIYSSNLRTTAVILQTLIEVGSDNPLLSQMAQWLVQRKQAGRWSTTQENFYVFYALNDFYRKYEDIQPDFNLQVSLEDKNILQAAFKDPVQPMEKSEISMSQFYPGKIIPLDIRMRGQGTLYYQTRMTYAPQNPLQARDEGFTVYKEITTLDGQPVSTYEAGSLVVVSLQIIVPQESLYVVVDDPLPAGLEAVNPTFLTESEEEQRRLRGSLEEPMRFRWRRGFNHIEMHDDRVLLFADSLSPGIHTHKYLARTLTPGTFSAPGTKIEEMYSPEVFGRSQEIKIEVKK